MYRSSDGFAANNGVRVERDPVSGTLWLATDTGGLYWTTDGDKWSSAHVADGLGSDDVFGVAVSDAGTAFVATDGGLSIHPR